MLEKPIEYKEIESQQNGDPIYAENINQIISNIEAIKGGESNEAPTGNIKDIYERLNKCVGVSTSSADLISFDNKKTDFDFSTDEYNFPPIKKKLKDSYNIKLIDEYDTSYNFILERQTDKYILKGSIKETLSKSSFILKISECDGIKDGGLITAELAQFFYLGKETQSKENEIKTEAINSNLYLKYTFNNAFGVPIFNITNENIEMENEKQTIIFNIEIAIENIKNIQDYILVYIGNINCSYLKIENQNNRVFIKGDITCSNSNSSVIIFSNGILENYFNIATAKNDSFYIKRIDGGITSNNGKELKYYFRKNIEDISQLESPISEATAYYLELKHTDETDIEQDEIININLPAEKNTDIYKIQKERNIQNAIEILNQKVNQLINHLGLGYNYNVYNFEKASILVDDETALSDNNTKDLSNLTLVKNSDSSYSLKGNIETIGGSSENKAILIKTTNKINKKLARNIIPAIMNQEKDILLMPIYNENYLYLYGQLGEGELNINLDDIKVIDSKIVLFNKDIIADAEISNDFGIYYENEKYKLKGQFTQNGRNIQSYVNAGIIDFFEIGITYEIPTTNGNIYIQLLSYNNIYYSLVIQGTQGQTYNLDYQLPKQPL